MSRYQLDPFIVTVSFILGAVYGALYRLCLLGAVMRHRLLWAALWCIWAGVALLLQIFRAFGV